MAAAVFWIALPVMALLCATNTAVRIARGHGLLDEHAQANARAA